MGQCRGVSGTSRRSVSPMSVFPSPRPAAGGPIIDFDPAACCLEIEGLSLAYGETPALRDLSLRVPRHRVTAFIGRSEEHTSELQSRPHLVCRLLLEKKKVYSWPWL